MASRTTSILNLPNVLSLSRLPLAAVAVYGVLSSQNLITGVAFWLAVVSDIADGRIARARQKTTILGGILDHGCDALFVAALLTAYLWRGEIPLCLPPLILIAFTQYLLDSRALQGHRLLASWLGRRNGVGYFVLAGVPATRDLFALPWPDSSWVYALGWVLILSTVVSIVDRAIAFISRQRAHASKE